MGPDIQDSYAPRRVCAVPVQARANQIHDEREPIRVVRQVHPLFPVVVVGAEEG